MRKILISITLLCASVALASGCASEGQDAEGPEPVVGANDSAANAPDEDAGPDAESSERVSEAEAPLSGGPGWHYTTWPATGLRPYNPSSCGGTVYCTFPAGTWVRWAGTLSSCGGPYDAYVHDSPCGSGWMRADALN